MIDDEAFPREVKGTIYCHHKLMTGGIEGEGLDVRGSRGRIGGVQAKGRGAGDPKRPACFDRTGNDWEYQNMSYLCPAIFLSVQAGSINEQAEKARKLDQWCFISKSGPGYNNIVLFTIRDKKQAN